MSVSPIDERVLPTEFEHVGVDDVGPHPENPRRGDVAALEESINSNGFYGALVVQRSTGRILVGNHRWEAARRQGITTLPVLWVDVDDEQAKRIMVVDNRAGELASWDHEQLVAVLSELSASAGSLDGMLFTEEQLGQFSPSDDDDDARLDQGGEHECPFCEARWRDTPDGPKRTDE
jgi:ParB-like chromosome segregation protein Spo0J